jgi:hypothetical protein
MYIYNLHKPTKAYPTLLLSSQFNILQQFYKILNTEYCTCISTILYGKSILSLKNIFSPGYIYSLRFSAKDSGRNRIIVLLQACSSLIHTHALNPKYI